MQRRWHNIGFWNLEQIIKEAKITENKLMNQMKAYIRKYNLIKKGDKIVVAFSGGPDSVYLLIGLLDLKEELNISLVAVHINHKLQKIAEEHAEFVRRFCEEHEVPLYYYEKDINSYARQCKISIEEAGRKFRYQKFYEVKKMLGFDLIAVAHHQDDRAETVLYRMARGTGWKGLAGIRCMQNEIIRPMLEISKKDIIKYLERAGQAYNTDPSNQDIFYARNRIRHQIVPELEQVNHQAVRHICDLAEQMDEIGEYLESEIRVYYDRCVQQKKGYWMISIYELEKCHAFMQKEILKRALAEAAGRERDLSRRHVQDLIQLAGAQTGRKIDLPYQVEALKQYDQLILQKKNHNGGSEEIFITEEGEYKIAFGNGVLKVKITQKNREILQNMYTKTFDYDKINHSMAVRTYRKGDYFIMNRQGQHKKLNRYFIDQKIPADQRSRIPIVADGSHVMWIIGKRASEAYQVTQETKSILQLSWEPMEETIMEHKISVLISEAEVDKKIRELGEQISRDYAGESVHLVCILKGSVFITCELAKRITVPVTMDFMSVSSYGDGTKSSGIVKLAKDLDETIEDKNVIVVEDIIDSGRTLSYLLPVLRERKPKSLKLFAFLDKPERRVKEVPVDYCGFCIPDEFVVGYGLDYAQKYRNLPYVGIVEV